MRGAAVSIVGVITLLAVSLRHPHLAARGWLCAFVLISMVPIGSLALLLVHGITGGRWGDDLKTVLIPAARCIPLLLIAVLPALVWRADIYDWQSLGLSQDVLSIYLTPAFFDARAIAALVLWSTLAWSAPWRRPVQSAMGALLHLILLSLIPADWVLTLPPGRVSAGFGFGFGCEQIFAAIAFAALCARQASDRASRDLTGILVTALLATVYFVYVQFLIVWYGNIPNKVYWYAVREGGWSFLVLAAFLIGAAVPFLAVLNHHVRGSPSALRIVGALVLIGIGLHVIWLMIPAFGVPALAPMALASITLMGALAWAWPRVLFAEAL